MAKKKKRRKQIEPGKFYIYKKAGEYLREKLGDDKGCKSYRIKEIKNGRKLLVCITNKKGPRGGRTKAVSLLRHIKVDLREYGKNKSDVKKALKKFRKLREKKNKRKKK